MIDKRQREFSNRNSPENREAQQGIQSYDSPRAAPESVCSIFAEVERRCQQHAHEKVRTQIRGWGIGDVHSRQGRKFWILDAFDKLSTSFGFWIEEKHSDFSKTHGENHERNSRN
jgi:hypothetical protein